MAEFLECNLYKVAIHKSMNYQPESFVTEGQEMFVRFLGAKITILIKDSIAAVCAETPEQRHYFRVILSQLSQEPMTWNALLEVLCAGVERYFVQAAQTQLLAMKQEGVCYVQ